MKKLLFATALFIGLAATAQQAPLPVLDTVPLVDSSKIAITVSLKASQHFLIIDFLQDVKTPRNADYIKQVVKQVDTTYNPDKLISVTTESGIIPELYLLLSIQREGVTATPNAEMKEALYPQLRGFTWIAAEIMRVDNENKALREQRALRGFQYIKSLKY